MVAETLQRHQVGRVRHERKRRVLTVTAVTRLTPKMLRIAFVSPDLADFVSASPDDHVKLSVPDPSAPETRVMRDYTPRSFDAATRSLTIDFALHDDGPATAWAMSAKPGDEVQIGGPRGSAVVPDDFDYYLLVGDETALPSIGRRVEALRPGVPVTTVVVVDGPEEAQTFETAARWTPVWAVRKPPQDDDAAVLREALQQWRAPEGEGYVWIAAEARVARAVRDHMLEDRGHPKAWMKAAGYWVRGKAGEDDKTLG